jgi:hypothetical protein
MGLSFKKREGAKPTWRDRRRAARRDAGWMSSYVVANDVDPWGAALADNVPCVVHDLSVTGAGLELARADVNIGDTLLLHLQLGGDRKASIQLTATVRHLTPTDHGCMRAGVEFLDMGTLEHALVQRVLDDLKRRKEPVVAPSGPIEIFEAVDGLTDLSELPDPINAGSDQR